MKYKNSFQHQRLFKIVLYGGERANLGSIRSSLFSGLFAAKLYCLGTDIATDYLDRHLPAAKVRAAEGQNIFSVTKLNPDSQMPSPK